jgi:hypothetical protein
LRIEAGIAAFRRVTPDPVAADVADAMRVHRERDGVAASEQIRRAGLVARACRSRAHRSVQQLL